jgi:hypothetical protein
MDRGFSENGSIITIRNINNVLQHLQKEEGDMHHFIIQTNINILLFIESLKNYTYDDDIINKTILLLQEAFISITQKTDIKSTLQDKLLNDILYFLRMFTTFIYPYFKAYDDKIAFVVAKEKIRLILKITNMHILAPTDVSNLYTLNQFRRHANPSRLMQSSDFFNAGGKNIITSIFMFNDNFEELSNIFDNIRRQGGRYAAKNEIEDLENYTRGVFMHNRKAKGEAEEIMKKLNDDKFSLLLIHYDEKVAEYSRGLIADDKKKYSTMNWFRNTASFLKTGKTRKTRKRNANAQTIKEKHLEILEAARKEFTEEYLRNKESNPFTATAGPNAYLIERGQTQLAVENAEKRALAARAYANVADRHLQAQRSLYMGARGIQSDPTIRAIALKRTQKLTNAARNSSRRAQEANGRVIRLRKNASAAAKAAANAAARAAANSSEAELAAYKEANAHAPPARSAKEQEPNDRRAPYIPGENNFSRIARETELGPGGVNDPFGIAAAAAHSDAFANNASLKVFNTPANNANLLLFNKPAATDPFDTIHGKRALNTLTRPQVPANPFNDDSPLPPKAGKNPFDDFGGGYRKNRYRTYKKENCRK